MLQHRFAGDGDLAGHAVGNLLIVALWEQLRRPVAGLDWVGRLLGASGRVLPMAAVAAGHRGAGRAALTRATRTRLSTVRGQVAVATTPGQVVAVCAGAARTRRPAPEAVAAVDEADWVVLGPGSWFTCVIPHLLVPELREALVDDASARGWSSLNLRRSRGRPTASRPETHLEVLAGARP